MQRVQNYLLTFHSKWITADKSLLGERVKSLKGIYRHGRRRFIYKMYRVITGFTRLFILISDANSEGNNNNNDG